LLANRSADESVKEVQDYAVCAKTGTIHRATTSRCSPAGDHSSSLAAGAGKSVGTEDTDRRNSGRSHFWHRDRLPRHGALCQLRPRPGTLHDHSLAVGGELFAHRRQDMTRWEVFTVLPLFISAGCGSLFRSFLNSPGRARWQQPEAVIRSLALQPGAQVADLGAGGGYFTFRLADAVGPAGKVYAVDVDKGNLDYIARRAQEQGDTNVETNLAK